MMRGLRFLMGLGIVALFVLSQWGLLNDSARQVQAVYSGASGSLELARIVSPGSSQSLRSDRIGGEIYRVAEVIDGDTYLISNAGAEGGAVRVRLIGIDAPETREGGGGKLTRQAKVWDVPASKVQQWGRAATRAARSLIGKRPVFIELDSAYSGQKHRGKRGRLLVYLWVAGGDGRPRYMLNEELLKRGHAARADAGEYRYRRRFAFIERYLKRAGAYPWSDSLR